jgi:hypothetical protein
MMGCLLLRQEDDIFAYKKEDFPLFIGFEKK